MLGHDLTFAYCRAPAKQLPCRKILDCWFETFDVGEKGRFDASHAAMKQLADARNGGWNVGRVLRELVVMATQDARRRTGGGMVASLQRLANHVAAADQAASAARKTWAGLIEPIWVERYLTERIEPLREELAQLTVRVRELDPVGYAALFGEG